MRCDSRRLPRLRGGLFLVVAVLLTACSRPEVTTPAASGPSPRNRLTPTEAAQRAAQLANEECARLYQRRPFTPDQHIARLIDGEYRWGGLDEGAPRGFSALVTFAPDGSKPRVEVYYSTDIVRPSKLPAEFPMRSLSPAPR
jgi:hypothetical protein